MEFKDYLRMPIKVKFAEFADKAEKAIRENYKEAFGIGNQEIDVYSASDSENSCNAVLTFQGVWKWHDEWWGGRSYEVNCTGEEIFNQFVKLIENDKIDNTMDCALHHFMNWVIALPTWKEDNTENTKILTEYLLNDSLTKYFLR